MADTRAAQSKVKPRAAPAVVSALAMQAPSNGLRLVIDASSADAPPPHTPIKTLQKMGCNLCGIPMDELSADKLNKARRSSDH